MNLTVTQGELDAVKLKLENIDQKIQIAERLNEEVSNSQEYQKILTSLLPSEKSEEQIVNELNDITFTQGMLVYSMSFNTEGIQPVEVQVPATDAAGNPLVDPVTGQYIYSETIPKLKIIRAEVGAIGDYTKIKGFLRKMISLKRTNNIASIKIYKDENTVSSDNNANANNGILKMEVAVDFNYLEKVKNTIDMDDGIFTAGQFNFSVLDDIWKTKNTVIPELRTDSQGASNPFVL